MDRGEVKHKYKTKLMAANYFFYAIVGFAVVATLSYLNKATVKHVESNENGEFLLRINKLYAIVGYAALAMGLIVITGIILTEKLDFAMYIIVLLLFLIFIGLGSLCVLNYRNDYLRFDNSKIQVRSPFGKTKEMYWNDIKSAKFNRLSGWIILKDKDGRKIKVHQHMVGLSTFISYLESNTDCTVKKLKLPAKPV